MSEKSNKAQTCYHMYPYNLPSAVQMFKMTFLNCSDAGVQCKPVSLKSKRRQSWDILYNRMEARNQTKVTRYINENMKKQNIINLRYVAYFAIVRNHPIEVL